MQTYSALFWLNKARLRNNEVPIFLRITINGKRAEISLKRSIEPAQWNTKTSRAKGNSEQARTLNNFLDLTKGKLLELHQSMLLSGKSVSSEELKNKFIGGAEQQKMLLEVFKIHNDAMKEKISIEFAKNTHIHYTTVYGKVKNFVKYKFKKTDIPLQDLNYKFMADFDYYLKTVEKLSHNTSMNYLRKLKKITNVAVLNGWLEKSPFATFKLTMKETQRGFLSQAELELLIKKEFEDKVLEEIRDIFIFSCYTGYAFIDMKNLSSENIHQDTDGQKWIITNRQKTAST
jgi:Phage integrase SAM-like domain/Arm DNA-binding domain